MLPQLRKLEQKFGNEIVIVGVHSGKFHAERETARIREACQRLGNPHPVVNDRQFRVWRAYAVRAWPTLAVIDPAGYVVGMHAGEFTAELLTAFLEAIIVDFAARSVLDRTPRHWPPDEPAIASGRLRYPGKVAVAQPPDERRIAPRRIAISDSGHHRLVVGALSEDGWAMRVERTVGSGSPGFADGAAPSFDSPQGLVFDQTHPAGDRLYVADAGNHAIRAIDLSTGDTSTLAGTGQPMRRHDESGTGPLSSPWDLALIGRTVYIAMAGIHQIWALDVDTGRTRVHAGAGGEDTVDGPLAQALLAQPMGIVAGGDGTLLFADAESSAIRWASVDSSGSVDTIVGTSLFDFGDIDGVGDAVRLEHPQGLAVHPDGRLLVADSYSDALKWLDPHSRRAERWIGDLHEPGGVAFADGKAYVADTNAHRIMVIDEQGERRALELGK